MTAPITLTALDAPCSPPCSFPAEENHADTLLDIVAEPRTETSGVRVGELPYAWSSQGQEWMMRYLLPQECLRRTVNTITAAARMAR